MSDNDDRTKMDRSNGGSVPNYYLNEVKGIGQTNMNKAIKWFSGFIEAALRHDN